ncbi:AI-2E family transporter [Aegicerativicinus sediminis]|uniref:AI-2E family transporter n=1 Tax=Aegicerativicinus sediminis TaxID=2893202 RepID=UPI001E47545A|nr:AI-2E family transporter [Aegicerativicinus sediminis]
MKKRKTTNMLLLIIVVFLVFYILKLLKFIFIPLVFSMFIALLFLPIMRFLMKRGVPRIIGIISVIIIIVGVLSGTYELIKISSKELLNPNNEIIPKVADQIKILLNDIGKVFNYRIEAHEPLISQFLTEEDFGPIFGFVQRTVSMILTTMVFVVLWLGESINLQKVLQGLLIKREHTSIKTFIQIEDNIILFIKVKFFVSLLTGIFTSLMCIAFDVSFPVFWGLLAFSVNFIQLVGSIFTVVSLSFFAMVELDISSVWLFFVLSITAVQVILGSILEPYLMGRSFSINVITVLVMLMLWGYIWGIPGMIMAIPITVFMKVIFEQFPQTQTLAQLISGRGIQIVRRKSI